MAAASIDLLQTSSANTASFEFTGGKEGSQRARSLNRRLHLPSLRRDLEPHFFGRDGGAE
jgi:hypothetical protein